MFEIVRLKKLDILIYVRTYFSIKPILLIGLHIYSLDIRDLFWDVKM